VPLQIVASERRGNANRANAQKSTGPKTPEGKAIASRNASKHRLCAATFILETEDLGEFEALRACYYTRFGPRDQVENELVDKMVHSVWNQKRAWAMEHESINLQMVKMAPDFAAKYSQLSPECRAALAFAELAGTPSLPLLHRYAARLSNEFHRALKTLLELQKNVPLLPPGTALPEPLQSVCQTDPILGGAGTLPAVGAPPASGSSSQPASEIAPAEAPYPSGDIMTPEIQV